MIPLEILTMGGGAVLGQLMKMMDQKAERDQRLMDSLNGGDTTRITQTPPQMMITRRIIALTVVFSVMVLPKLAALAGLPVVYGEPVPVSWLGGLFGISPTTSWFTVGGMPITPSDTHALCAVIGLYFGGRRT